MILKNHTYSDKQFLKLVLLELLTEDSDKITASHGRAPSDLYQKRQVQQ